MICIFMIKIRGPLVFGMILGAEVRPPSQSLRHLLAAQLVLSPQRASALAEPTCSGNGIVVRAFTRGRVQ